MKQHFLFFRTLALMFALSNLLSVQAGAARKKNGAKASTADTATANTNGGHTNLAKKSTRAKRHEKNQTIHIVYNCATQNFDTAAPTCVEEYTQVVVRYTHVNPFLYGSQLAVAQIDGKWDDGMTNYYKIEKTTGTEAAATQSAKTATGLPGNDNTATPGRSAARPLGGRNAPADTVSSLLNEKVRLLTNIQSKLRAIETAIYSVNQLMQLDTVIKVCRKNPANRSAELMKADIGHRITFAINAGSDIQSHFDGDIRTILDTIKAVRDTIALLDRLNERLSQKSKVYDFSAVIEEITTNVNKIAESYAGENLETLMNNVTAIKNNYQNTISAEYFVNGDSVVCARGEYLQLKDVGMKIDFEPIKIKHGSRIDFSVGVAVTMGDITGWNYTLNKVNDSTVYLVTDKENKIAAPSPVVMMHWYATRCNNTAWMMTFGVSPDIVTLNDAKLFLGGSVAGLSSNKIMRRFILSAGVVFGSADVLKAKYRNKDREPDNNFHSFGNISDSDLTEKSFRAGGFISVTWNLGGI